MDKISNMFRNLKDSFFHNVFDLPRAGPFFRRLRYDPIFSSLAHGEVAIDCGANIGLVTDRMVRPGVEVIAFEPNPHAFESLKKRFSGNESVKCLNRAIGTQESFENFYMHQNYSSNPAKWSSGSSLISDKGNINKDDYIKVEVIDFVKFLSEINKPIGIIKMDIEGSEVEVLNKMIDSGLINKPRHIIVETHERIPSLNTSTKLLKKRVAREGINNIDFYWA